MLNRGNEQSHRLNDIPQLHHYRLIFNMPISISESVEKLMPLDGVLLTISDENNENISDEHRKDKYKLTHAVLRRDSTQTASTGYPAPIEYCLPLNPLGKESVDIVCLRRFPVESSNPLDILTYVVNVLRPGGFFLCDLPGIHTDSAIERAEDHIAYLIALASRCGLTVASGNEIAIEQIEFQPLVFQKKRVMPLWQIGHLSDPGFASFSKLFRDSFDLESNLPLWNWKYGEGRGRCVIATREGRLIAHYGGTLRAVSLFGDVGTAIQICDVMVDPHERGVMTRQGAMYITTTTFLEIYLGLLQYDIAYGFPNRRHMQLGERLGLYAEVARMVEIRWHPTNSNPSPWSRLHALNADSLNYQGLINKVSNRRAKDLAVTMVIIRNW